MLRDIFGTIYGLWSLLRHVRRLPTSDRLRELGVEPPRPMPYPPFFGGQRR